MDALLLHEYIDRISRLLDSEVRLAGSEHNLQPVQLHALQFLNRCNRYSNTLQGVTAYLGLTKGTVSQTLAVLEGKGFIKKNVDKKDGRVFHLNVTGTGEKLLSGIVPSPTASKALKEMKSPEVRRLVEGLKKLLTEMQKTNDMNSFGVCKTCRYNTKINDKKHFCELTRENLTLKDIELLCLEHKQAS